MCRPVNGSRAEACPGGHIGPPLRGVGSVREPTEIGAGRKHSPAGRDGARPLQGAEQPGGGVRLGCGFRQPNSETEFGASVKGIGPYGEKGKSHQPPRPAAHSGAFAVRMGGMGGNRSRDHPQNVQQRRTIPQSRPLAVPAPFTQGSLWGRGMRIAASALRASSQ